MNWWYVFGFVVYVIGILVDLDCTTLEVDRIVDNGGFFGPDVICNNRSITAHDVRISFMWPLRLLFWFVLTFIYLLNDVIGVIVLATGYDYRTTRVYKWIEKVTGC